MEIVESRPRFGPACQVAVAAEPWNRIGNKSESKREQLFGTLEAIRTILEVAQTRRSVLAPRFGLRTNVVCYAKKPLAAEDMLDGPGGYASYGLIENIGEAAEPGFPICLAHNVRLRRAIGRDERIGWKDIYEATMAPAVLDAYRQNQKAAAELTRA